MPPVSRYDDPCGIARALDVVGDRWALMVVRELIFGPKRFSQLRTGLHSVSPNVLAQRLRDLEASGLVRRALLGPPASVAVYQLTDRGSALEPVLIELGRWGSREPLATTSELSTNALLLALKSLFNPARAITATFALAVASDWFEVHVVDGSIDIVHSRSEHVDVIFETDVSTLRAVAFGRETIAAAEKAGRLDVTGNRRIASSFAAMFPVPPPASISDVLTIPPD